jgi:transposase
LGRKCPRRDDQAPVIKLEDFKAIYLYLPTTDIRKSIDGLSGIVQEQLKLNPFGKYLFIFSNRRRNRVKILYWDKTGFVIWYKRLEKSRWSSPKNLDTFSKCDITLMQGVSRGQKCPGFLGNSKIKNSL